MSVFRIAAFSDWRVQEFEPLLIKLKNRRADLVLYGGDDTNRFGPLNLTKLLAQLDEMPDLSNPYNPFIGFGIHLIYARDFKRKDFRQYVKNTLRERQTRIEGRVSKRDSKRPSAGTIYSDGIFHFSTPSGKTSCLFIFEQNPPDSWATRIANTAKHGFGAVIGNDCMVTDTARLSGENIFDLHSEPLVVDDIGIIGLQGASIPPGRVLYEEEDARNHLECQWKFLEESKVKNTILVTHAPPRDVLDYSIRFDMGNIGSTAVREFIKTHELDLVICGHSHLNGGRMETVDGTTVVNIASHDDWDALGRLAWISLETDGKISIDFTEVQPFIGSELLVLPHVGRKRIRQFSDLGITALDQIVPENEALLSQPRGSSYWHARLWIMAAEAIRTNTAYRISHPDWIRLQENKWVIYDIETDLKGKPWCVGVWNPVSNSIEQFYNPDNQAGLLTAFFNFVKAHHSAIIISFSGTRFDKRNLVDCANAHAVEVPDLIKTEIDLGILTQYHTVGLPCSNLKGLGNHFGYEWSQAGMDGLQAGIMVDRYYRNGIKPDWEMLLAYNRDDVNATKIVLEKLLALNEIADTRAR
jgi:Icc-related predicted phosphoesterase